MTSARQIYLGSRRGPALPYDAEVEYLESTGTQWIDTGYTSANKDEVITATINNYADTNLTQPIFVSWGADTSARLQLYKTTGRIGAAYVNFSVPANRVLTVTADIPRLCFYINGVRYAASGMTAPRIDIPLGLLARNGDSTRGVLRLYQFTITRSAIAVMDMIPVRFTNELGQPEGAMYDRASGQLFRNSGTGVFGFGTDIAGGGYKWLEYSPLWFSRFSRLWKEAA